MLAFNECKKYEDYLSIIRDYILTGGINSDRNEKGFSYLSLIKDLTKQEKVIKIFKMLDKSLSSSTVKDNEMWKKISSMLAVGIFSFEYHEYFDKLSPKSIFTFISGGYQAFNDSNKKYIPIFCSEKFLNSIYEASKSDTVSYFEIMDYFFMIQQHYDKNEFDISNENLREEFVNEMIRKINNNTIHDGVKNLLEFWNSGEMLKLISEVQQNSLGGVKK